ncbi:protein of unknown function [Candidatus Promineifilum breve]|uniref:Uncharacterized protein n=1 Tax=Candidatus Promineifilum breve TaxID=1806508 RepID=A0A160T735_9CHLR|nr:protein of unknown function [Candidatus Promineifilum breve]
MGRYRYRYRYRNRYRSYLVSRSLWSAVGNLHSSFVIRH